MDAGRALAILLVTAFHTWAKAGSQVFGQAGGLALSDIFANGYVGVDLFFVISGYAMVLTWRRHPTSSGFWLARLMRIYPTYAAAVLIWVIVLRLGGWSQPRTAATDIFSHLTMTHTFWQETFFSISGVMWTLAVEAHFYLIFPALILAPRWGRFGITLASLCYIAVMPIFWPGPKQHFYIYNVVSFLPLFVLGMEIAERENERLCRVGAWLAVGVAITAIFARTPAPGMAADHIGRLIVGGGLALGCLVLIPKQLSPSAWVRIVTLIATASYSIYLYNYAFWLSPFANTAPVANFALVIAIGLGMWWLIERPAEAWRKRFLISDVKRIDRPSPLSPPRSQGSS